MTKFLCPIFAGLISHVLAAFRRFLPFYHRADRYRNSDTAYKSLIFLLGMVGATGIEPVTPTVSK